MTIWFPDVSNHQNGLKIQPKTAAVFAKATEGTTYADPLYANFKAQAASVGAVFAAYHWLWSGTPAEAKWVYTHVGKTPLMIDAENPKVKTTISMILSFVTQYRRLGGVVHLVYLPRWYWQSHLGSPDLRPLARAGLQLVSSDYTTYSDNGPGWAKYGNVAPLVWQYTDALSYGGQHIDFNAFKGSVAQLRNVLMTGQLEAPTPVPKPPAPKPKPAPATTTYKIRSGDTFWDLESAHHWAHGTLQKLNPKIDPNSLRIGQVIVIPSAAKPKPQPKPKPTPTSTYKIRPGDTLWALEEAHHWAHGTLQHLNPKVDPARLRIGQRINVPRSTRLKLSYAPGTVPTQPKEATEPMTVGDFVEAMHAIKTGQESGAWTHQNYPDLIARPKGAHRIRPSR